VKVISCEQGSKQWADARRGIATASNASRIVTPSDGKFSKSAYAYACELIAAQLLPPYFWIDGDDYQSEAMAHGTRTEREAREFFQLETDLVVREVGFILADDGLAGCSPDGVIDKFGVISELLELKCPLHKTHVAYLDKGELPSEYKPQVHWALVVTNCKACHFMSYAVGLPPLVLRIEQDAYTEKVRAAMAEFWTLFGTIKAHVESVRDCRPARPAATKPDVDLQRAFPLTG
jgi:putative phage-type endonuclease